MSDGRWIAWALVMASLLGLTAQAVAYFWLNGAANTATSAAGTAVVVSAFVTTAVLYLRGRHRRASIPRNREGAAS